MTDPSDLLNLIGSGGSIFDEIGMNSMPSSSLPQNSTTDQYFNMDSFQNFPNQTNQQQQPGPKLHHLDGQSPPNQEQYQTFSQKLSHFANPMLNQQNAFQNSAPSNPPPQQQQQFPRMGMRMQSPTQFSPQPSTSPVPNWRGQSNVGNSFGNNFMQQQPPQASSEQNATGTSMQSQSFVPMSSQQTNMQRLQHFMTNKQSNPMLSQSSNPFMSQADNAMTTLTDISNSTPKMNSQNKTVSPQYNPEMVRQEQMSKLHHMVSGGMQSPTSASDTATNSNSSGFPPSSNSSFTGSPDPFSQNKNLGAMYNSMQQQPSMTNQAPMQSQDPFTQTQPPVSNAMPQDYMMRRPQQFHDSSYPMRPNNPFQQQVVNQSPNPMSNQLKTAHLLYQLQRLQQQITQVRELPSPAKDQPLQQLQQQFSRLYHMYLMDQQRQKKQAQAAAQMRFDQENMLKQQHQEKANRIVAEAIAKSALMNSGYNYQAEPQMKYFGQQFGPGVKGPMNYDMQQDIAAQRKAAEPIVLPPSIVNQLPKTVRNSSKPPATVLNKPVVKRERRDSSDHEPSPPNSPGSYYAEDNTPSSITRRSLRERKKKTYKDDFDYNLSEEEDAKTTTSGEVKSEGQDLDAMGALPVGEEVPMPEENLTVEKIISLRTETNEDGFAQEEFLVKYKNYSYLHCEWATAEKLMRLDKRVQMKIKRFFMKRNSMPFPEDLDDEPFNPDYVEVDRVLDVSTCVDQSTGQSVSHYLVKWRSLPYDESTWEVEADVDNNSVNQFLSNKKAPPPHERQFRRRPHPSEWRKLDSSPLYKNSNTLREYQLEGLNWLTFCWYNGQNCILADEMGLGKTIQSLTFLLHVKQYGIRGPFLVIAPLSTIANWQREFESWGDMNAVVHHGSAASRHLIQQYEFYFRGPQGEPIIGIYKFNVLITTYEILIADNMLLSSVPWRVVVIDEAHRLKNRNCKLLEGLNNLQMEHRILLTGTPLQNNVDELFSLLNFLEPAQFPSQGAFLMEFGNLRTEAQVERLQALLRPMMLRRMKEDVEKSLAPKEETIVEVELTTVQKKFYRAILERNFSFLNKGAVSTSNVPNLMNTMMELRKCCNHPFLINGAEEKIVGEYQANFTGENRDTIHLTSLIEASGKLVLIDKLLPKLKAGGHKVLIFSQMVRCLDILEDYLICKKYLFERIDGRVRGNLRQAAIDRFSKPDSDRFIFLLCTRAGGLGINLTAADTVIIFDSDWNPQNDLQAQARCHRIGQAKSVKVYRLITRNSYEREMFDRASLKLGLDKAVLQSMSSKDGSANAAGGQNPALSKKEIEDLLKKGAYGAVMEDDEASSKFCEEDIDQILERRTQVITIDSVGQGSTFAKASFTATKKGEDIDIDDPDFWKKWAMKADIDVDELMNKDERIIDAPRQRKQTKRYGRGDDVDFELSDLDSDNEVPQAKRRAWTRVECFKVEKNLLIYGWQRWQDIIHAIRKRKLSEREVEAISRSILLFCVHAYRGDEKLRSFILELIKPIITRERLPSEELDATYMPVLKGSGKKAKKGSKKGKSSKKDVNKSAIALIEAVGDWKSVNPELLILDEGYKKHLRHHCNKILLRVRLLYIMRVEVIGAAEIAVRNDCLASDINVNLPVTEGDPPIGWWNEDADKSLVIGVYKHGYERYNAIRADPSLIFLKKCGPPTAADEANTGDNMDGEGMREDDDRDDDLSRDDPDYQLPQDKNGESDDDEDFEMQEGKVKETHPADKNGTKDDKPPVVEGNSASTSNFLAWPSPSDLNTRLRRIVAGFQRILKKEELKRVAVEKENRRKEKVEEAVRQKELKKAEQAQKWSKREEVDFYRCVSTYGVHINSVTGEYDWSKFRQMARLDKKNDERLSAYLKEFLAMCKRVCGRASDEEIILGQNVEAISEERANRCLRRVELMTVLRLEVLNHPELDERLKLAQVTPELPSWWRCEKHDKDLLFGVAKHGLTRTDLNILEDPELSFYELKSEMDAQHIALAGSSANLASGSPESVSRSVSGTPVPFERVMDKTAMERVEGQEASLDPQSFPVIPKPTSVIQPNPQTTASSSATTADNTSRDSQPAPPAAYDKQQYINDAPSFPGTNALSSLVKQVSSLPTNPENISGGDFDPGIERRADIQPQVFPPPHFVDNDSQGALPPDVNNLNPVINESLSIKIWWPKDRVVFQRVQQLCQLVVTGEWPSKPEKPERLVDQQVYPAGENSMSPGGFPGYGEGELDGGLGPEALVDPKAFKIKKHEGLKVTLKKNRKRKKKDEEGTMMDGVGEMHVPPDALVPPVPYSNDGNYPPLKMDNSEIGGRMPLEKPRKKRQRRMEKPPKPPAEKKKRGRKPRMEKLMAQAAADAIHAGLTPQPGGKHVDWARAGRSGGFIPGEIMNGPGHESVLVQGVNMRRGSLESPLSEPPRVPPQANAMVEAAPNSTTVRTSVLKSTTSADGEREGHPRRLSSTSSHPDKDLLPPLKSPNVPTSPAMISPKILSPSFSATEPPYPFMGYPNFPPNSGVIGFSHPPASTSPGFPAGYVGQPQNSAGSSPTSTSSSSSVGHAPQKTVYESSFPAKSPTNIVASKLSESVGFNGFQSNISNSTANFTKHLALDDPEMKVFNSDSENEPSDSLEASEEEGVPLSPAPL